MLEVVSQLIELQRLDNLIADAEEKLSGNPEYLTEASEKLEKAQAEFDQFNEKYEKDNAEKIEVEKSYEENKTLLDKAQTKLPEVKNNKEYEAVLKEMDVLKKNVEETEEKLKVLRESVEKFKNDNESITKALEEAKKAVEDSLKKKENENAELTAQLAENKEARKDAAKDVKKSLLAKYDRVRKARNNLAVVRVDDETCTGCCIKIPPQLYVEVMKDQELLQCPNCQRFLYPLAEEEDNA
jgi:predicted  nucleic acid-binding Zn-ribbon protein